MTTRAVLLTVLLAVPRLVWPCSVVAPMPTPDQLVARATVVVRARAMGVGSAAGQPGLLAGSRTQVNFEVIEVLKGTLATAELQFNGGVSGEDDPGRRHRSLGRLGAWAASTEAGCLTSACSRRRSPFVASSEQ